MSSSLGERLDDGGGSGVPTAVAGSGGETGMVSNFVMNTTEIRPPFSLPARKIFLSEAVAKQWTSYEDYKEKIVVQTAQDGIPRRVARVDELMALSHRRAVAMMFYGNARELSEQQLWDGLGRIAKVQRDTDVDAEKLQRDLQPLLRWSSSRSLSDNLARVTGGLVGYLEENDLTDALMDENGNWLKGPGKIVARLWTGGLTPPRSSRWRCAAAVNSCQLRVILRG